MSSQKSKPISRAPFLYLGYILAFAIVLMAFEYRDISYIEKSLPEWEPEKTFIPQVQQAPEKPSPQKKRPHQEQKGPDHVTPEVVKERASEKSKPSDLQNEDLGISYLDEGGKQPSLNVPDRPPQGVVSDHKLSRYAILSKCRERSGKGYQEKCTHKKIREHISSEAEYPEMLEEQGIDGSVLVAFEIDRNGEIQNIQTPDSPHKLFSRSVKKAVRELPGFIPAKMNGHKVRIRHVLRIRFKTH